MLDEQYVRTLDNTYRILNDENFVASYEHLLRFQIKARQERANAEPLLLLQAEMANEVIHLQQGQRKYAGWLKDGTNPHLDLAGAIEACKAMVFSIKKVADGIAWRSLGHDRGMIHALSDANLPGHMERQAAISEVAQAAERVALTGDLVLLNDLTYVIRFADITSISERGVSLGEVKTGKGSAHSGRATRQKARLADVIDYVNAREKTADSGVWRLTPIAAAPRAHASELAEVLHEARKNGQSHRRLSRALAVEAFWTPSLNLDQLPRHHNPFEQSQESSFVHSLRYFGMPTPLVAPYTIFPWCDEDCVDVLTGRLLIITFYNGRNIVRALMRRGLEVRLPTAAEIAAAPTNLRPGEIAQHELDLPIKVWNGKHTLLMSPAQLGRLSLEFLNEESFADMVVEHLSNAGPDEAYSYPWFAQEHTLWD